MALYVVDTSVLTRLRAHQVVEIVRPLARVQALARAGISDQGIGFSARNAGEWDRLTGALAVFGLIETDGSHVRRAREVQRMLSKVGQCGRKLPDLLVAAAAEESGLTCFIATRISISSPP